MTSPSADGLRGFRCVWVVSGWSPARAEMWIVGVYTSSATAERIASEPRRSCEQVPLDWMPTTR